MKNTKMFAVIMSVVLVLGLASCGGGSKETKEPASVNGQSSAEKGDSTGETGEKETEESESASEEPAGESSGKSGPETIEEVLLVDEEGIRITAKSLDKKGSIFGPSIKLLLENESGQNLTFQCRGSSVNGYMVETMMSADVADGKKANEDLVFANADLKDCGIETIADLEFSFHIFDTESWDTYLDTDRFTILTSAAEGYEYTFDDSGFSAYEEDDIKIVIKGLAEDESIFGPSILVYIDNGSDQDITVQVRDVSINGFMVDPMFSCDVCSGKHAIDGITFMSSELEENEIEQIEDVELSFHIFDADDWETIADTDVITISF